MRKSNEQFSESFLDETVITPPPSFGNTTLCAAEQSSLENRAWRCDIFRMQPTVALYPIPRAAKCYVLAEVTQLNRFVTSDLLLGVPSGWRFFASCPSDPVLPQRLVHPSGDERLGLCTVVRASMARDVDEGELRHYSKVNEKHHRGE